MNFYPILEEDRRLSVDRMHFYIHGLEQSITGFVSSFDKKLNMKM